MPLSNIFVLKSGVRVKPKKSPSQFPSTCVFQMEQYIQNQIFGSLRSKRFQSSYCAKVRAEAKKRFSPPPFPVIHFFFALAPAF